MSVKTINIVFIGILLPPAGTNLKARSVHRTAHLARRNRFLDAVARERWRRQVVCRDLRCVCQRVEKEAVYGIERLLRKALVYRSLSAAAAQLEHPALTCVDSPTV